MFPPDGPQGGPRWSRRPSAQLAVTWGRKKAQVPGMTKAGSAGGVGSSPLQNLSGFDCCLVQGLPVLPLGQGLRHCVWVVSPRGHGLAVDWKVSY